MPERLRWLASIAWRLLVIGAAIFFIWQVLQRISVVMIATVLALFPASLLWGPVKSLKRRGWKPLLATWTVFLVAAIAAVGVGFLVVPALIEGLEPLGEDLVTAYGDLLRWLTEGPLGLSPEQIDGYVDTLLEQLQSQLGGLGSGVLSGAVAVFEVITGLMLALIVAFFILKDGDRAATKLINRLSPDKADQVRRGGRVAWSTLNRYVKGLSLVGLVDATAIAIGLLILDVPLVAPLAILVFLGAFLPVIGAFASGLFAVAVAGVNGGLTDALIVLAIVVAVQQLEGDIILPMVFGRTMQLHPLVILLAIAIGGVAFGIVGAFLSVPIAAVVVAVNQELSPDPEKSLLGLAQTID